MGRRGAAELRPRAPRRPDHRVRLVAPRLGHLRRRRADRGRRQLPRRHPADPQPHRRHAMGQRRLPRLERLGQRRRLPGAGPARSTRRSDPGERRAAPADVRAVPQPGLRRRATGRGAADVRRRRRLPGAVAVPVADGDTDPVRPAPGVGGRHVHRRPGPTDPDRPRRPQRRRAGAGPRPRRPRRLPRWRLPPWRRGAVDAARAVDVVGRLAGCACGRRRSSTSTTATS